MDNDFPLEYFATVKTRSPEADITEELADGTIYLFFGGDPSTANGYIKKIYDDGAGTITSEHAKGLWANRATLTYTAVNENLV